MKVGFPCGLLLIALAAILAYGLPPALGAELPNKAIGQGLPLPEVGGTAQIEVRKKHWRIWQPSKRQYDDLIKRGLDPHWRYGPAHYLEIRFITKPELSKKP